MDCETFLNEVEHETKKFHFCVIPTNRKISLAYAWDFGDDSNLMLNVDEARQLREWLDKVIP